MSSAELFWTPRRVAIEAAVKVAVVEKCRCEGWSDEWQHAEFGELLPVGDNPTRATISVTCRWVSAYGFPMGQTRTVTTHWDRDYRDEGAKIIGLYINGGW